MINEKRRLFYYVADCGNGFIHIIDGVNYDVLRDIEIGSRLQRITADSKKNLYVANDRNSTVSLINGITYKCDLIWDIPNNGNILADNKNNRLYVLNTDEICIYDCKSGEELKRIKGFMAADCMCMSSTKGIIFILDKLKNEIKAYDMNQFKLVRKYDKINKACRYILLSENEKYLYISSKGIRRGRYSSGISILNLDSGSISSINLEKDSEITVLARNKKWIYGANNGLHRIDILDGEKRKYITSIKTRFPQPSALKVSQDEKILIVGSYSASGKGAVQIFDTETNNLLKTIIFKQDSSVPYDIEIISLNQAINKMNQNEINKGVDEGNDEEMNYELVKNKKSGNYEEKENKYIIKKVLSSYTENISFKNIKLKSLSEEKNNVSVESIAFKKCQIINGSKKMMKDNKKNEHSIVTADFYIPYLIKYKDSKKEYILEGKLKGKFNVLLYTGKFTEEDGLEFIISSKSRVIDEPVILNNIIKFNTESIISIKAISDYEVYI